MAKKRTDVNAEEICEICTTYRPTAAEEWICKQGTLGGAQLGAGESFLESDSRNCGRTVKCFWLLRLRDSQQVSQNELTADKQRNNFRSLLVNTPPTKGVKKRESTANNSDLKT
ncbi:unnamed protein product [Clavelina lepadiformis]|uniref:Uncharacterized protein n=1 Tax=Clavelina lepadiformis TaxID=159417 RepID=A0ABP0F5C8_CLALP